MRNRIAKLVLALALLTGAAIAGVAPRPVAAQSNCQDFCVDPDCFCIIHCHPISGAQCRCEDFCSIE